MLYSQPATLDDAVTALTADPDAKCLAGGATLVATLNEGKRRPNRLVSLQDIPELQGIDVGSDGRLRIGAMTSHAVVAKEARLNGGLSLVRSAASQIAHPAIRSMATIGGSLAVADPSADYPSALLGSGAEVEIASPGGRRFCAIDDFFLGYLKSVLSPGEILVAVRLPPSAPGETSKFLKYSRVDGDFATVTIAVRLGWKQGACASIRIAVGSCAPTPFRVPAAEQKLVGGRLDDHALAEVGKAYAEAAKPNDDMKGSADFRRMLIPGLLARAVKAAHGGVA